MKSSGASADVFESALVENAMVVHLKSQALEILSDDSTATDFCSLLDSVDNADDIQAYVQINDSESYRQEAVDDLAQKLFDKDDQTLKQGWHQGFQKDYLAAMFRNTLGRIQLDLMNMNKITIAGLGGRISGEYLGLALCFDLRVATVDTVFTFENIRTGIPPGPGLTNLMPRFIGLGRALALINRGATIDARKALELGLISDIVETREELSKWCIQEVQGMTGYQAKLAKFNRDRIFPAAEKRQSALEQYYDAMARAIYAARNLS
jgi:enoyl-CoA hydratase/carnithine racemase